MHCAEIVRALVKSHEDEGPSGPRLLAPFAIFVIREKEIQATHRRGVSELVINVPQEVLSGPPIEIDWSIGCSPLACWDLLPQPQPVASELVQGHIARGLLLGLLLLQLLHVAVLVCLADPEFHTLTLFVLCGFTVGMGHELLLTAEKTQSDPRRGNLNSVCFD